MDLSGYARNFLFCNGKSLGIYMLLHQSTTYADANNNGLHAGTDNYEITKSGFVWFCKKALQLLLCYVKYKSHFLGQVLLVDITPTCIRKCYVSVSHQPLAP